MLSTRSIPVAQMLRRPARLAAWLILSLSWSLPLWLVGMLSEAQAQTAKPVVTETLSTELRLQVQDLAQAGAKAGMPAQARVEVQVGQLDPRLKLAPCAQVQPYLPTGLQMWGRTRIGLRCIDGRARWNVTLPVQVKVYARALVAAEPLASGVSLTQAQLAMAEIDIASVAGAVFTDAAGLTGRSLVRPVAAGEAISSSSLRARQWFAAGETVQVRVSGPGFAVAGEGQAMAAGLEGQNVKIRFENGRMVTGRVVGERRVEVLL
ncbi:flagellar basal body P-ring formation chaperone FlgA [Kinneretia aquatilis]|nr:flagellar basal body P-ring formation chaperone FlgA [Paucibacter aquatile]